MVKITRTINPLHFEDLEPHRFEDLVRQLIYEFRDWRSLEATGRTGSDDGFDARGFEITNLEDEGQLEEDEEPQELSANDKLWLIQCKREKAISPKKIEGYLKDIVVDKEHLLQGLIFVAACDFSKKTRDIFRSFCLEKEISEYYIWGKAELEDLLFQPKNDHLLFAYFGISIVIKRRSLSAKIRSILAIKRKAVKYIGDLQSRNFKEVLLRDLEESRYPFKDDIPNFDKHPKWKIYRFEGHSHDGLKFLVAKFHAYLADDKTHFDFFDKINLARPLDDPWKKEDDTKNKELISKFLDTIPEQNKAWIEIVRNVSYEKIITIDEVGDVYFQEPHIYVPFDKKHGPFEPYMLFQLKTSG